jgi:hypothetical protein
MTEESYQQCRKLMQSINYQRGLITNAKGEVAKWTKIEAVAREQLREAQANGAKKMLDKAMAKLDALRAKFAAVSFPDSNIVTPIARNFCELCGTPIAVGFQYCGGCMGDQDVYL